MLSAKLREQRRLNAAVIPLTVHKFRKNHTPPTLVILRQPATKVRAGERGEREYQEREREYQERERREYQERARVSREREYQERARVSRE